MSNFVGNDIAYLPQVFLIGSIHVIERFLQNARGEGDGVGGKEIPGVDRVGRHWPDIFIHPGLLELCQQLVGSFLDGNEVVTEATSLLRRQDLHIFQGIVPVIRVPNVNLDGVQLFNGLFLGGLAHPIQRFNPVPVNRQDVLNHFLHIRLGLWGEIAVYIGLAEIVAHHLLDILRSTVLQGKGTGRAHVSLIKCVARFCEFLMQRRTKTCGQIQTGIRLQNLQSVRGFALIKDLRPCLELSRVHDLNVVGLCQSGQRKKRLQIHPGEHGLQLLHGVNIIGFVYIRQFLVAQGRRRNFGVYPPNGIRRRGRSRLTLPHQSQHGADIGLIGRLLLRRGSAVSSLPQGRRDSVKEKCICRVILHVNV